MEQKIELYRKYRPTSYDDLVGNEATVNSVKKELENGSHVFLFTGPAGTGKTTLARIIAKQVNAGELSIREINSANNTGIDTARQIMEQMRYNPSDGDSLVWILDEVHMLSNSAQNAFLKALEDTPTHVYFFLCTTDPQKLIAPLKSRCSIVSMKPLTDEQMTYLLKRTARSEKIKLPNSVCDKICEQAQGGSRKALKLLNKILYLETEDEMLEVLSTSDSSDNVESIELCRALLSKGVNWAQISKILKNIDMSEPERIRMGVLGYMNSVLLNGMNGQAVCAIQAFGANTTFNNGKAGITIACLDFLDMMNN